MILELSVKQAGRRRRRDGNSTSDSKSAECNDGQRRRRDGNRRAVSNLDYKDT